VEDIISKPSCNEKSKSSLLILLKQDNIDNKSSTYGYKY
jgi:hypothetical protein